MCHNSSHKETVGCVVSLGGGIQHSGQIIEKAGQYYCYLSSFVDALWDRYQWQVPCHAMKIRRFCPQNSASAPRLPFHFAGKFWFKTKAPPPPPWDFKFKQIFTAAAADSTSFANPCGLPKLGLGCCCDTSPEAPELEPRRDTRKQILFQLLPHSTLSSQKDPHPPISQTRLSRFLSRFFCQESAHWTFHTQ